ncbi:hypothetical protein [Nostoc sp.]
MQKAGGRLKLAPRNLQTGLGLYRASLVNELLTALKSLMPEF